VAAIFLSASVPLVGRGDFHETANPFLIQCAVRELFMAVVRDSVVVWGGHPSITPMIWSICTDLGVDYSRSVVLYQSMFFKDMFPEENERFGNVVFTDVVDEDPERSLELMRQSMLSRGDLDAAVFIGGMEGVVVEHDMFCRFHPGKTVLPVASAGGAALQLAHRIGTLTADDLETVDYAALFNRHLGDLGRNQSMSVGA
jgi:hypothetical protein